MLLTHLQYAFALVAFIWAWGLVGWTDATKLSQGVEPVRADNAHEHGGKRQRDDTTLVAFSGRTGMKVTWDVSAPSKFDFEPLTVPGRRRFSQGAIHRLRLSCIPNHEDIELFPTLEIAPTTPRTAAYLANNAVPFHLTDEDLDQLLSGSFVTKVIYLPDREFQKVAQAGIRTLVSTRLRPGIDPVVEADRRGSIVAIIRVGTKDILIVESSCCGLPASNSLRVRSEKK